MPSVTSYSPCLAFNWDWRQRLGFAVVGHSSLRKLQPSICPDDPPVLGADDHWIERADEAAIAIRIVGRIVNQEIDSDIGNLCRGTLINCSADVFGLPCGPASRRASWVDAFGSIRLRRSWRS